MRPRLIGAITLLIAYLVLGSTVSPHDPGPLDASSRWFVGQATPLATSLTRAGLFPVYFTLSVVALVFGIGRREWLAVVVVGIVGLVGDWQVSDVFKLAFHRLRPPHPLYTETSYAYASGHAALSIFVYGFVAYCVSRSDASPMVKQIVAGFAIVWVLGIGWSRLALAAHYPTDVLGGYLFGGAWLMLAMAAADRFIPVRPSLPVDAFYTEKSGR
jgi:undecaprenyl-diphosphatase